MGRRRAAAGLVEARLVDTAAPDCVDSDGVTVFRVPAAAVRIDEAATAVD